MFILFVILLFFVYRISSIHFLEYISSINMLVVLFIRYHPLTLLNIITVVFSEIIFSLKSEKEEVVFDRLLHLHLFCWLFCLLDIVHSLRWMSSISFVFLDISHSFW